jgi:hypothetical protein
MHKRSRPFIASSHLQTKNVTRQEIEWQHAFRLNMLQDSKHLSQRRIARELVQQAKRLQVSQVRHLEELVQTVNVRPRVL